MCVALQYRLVRLLHGVCGADVRRAQHSFSAHMVLEVQAFNFNLCLHAGKKMSAEEVAARQEVMGSIYKEFRIAYFRAKGWGAAAANADEADGQASMSKEALMKGDFAGMWLIVLHPIYLVASYVSPSLLA